jgi:hypothetical protein
VIDDRAAIPGGVGGVGVAGALTNLGELAAAVAGEF